MARNTRSGTPMRYVLLTITLASCSSIELGEHHRNTCVLNPETETYDCDDGSGGTGGGGTSEHYEPCVNCPPFGETSPYTCAYAVSCCLAAQWSDEARINFRVVATGTGGDVLCSIWDVSVNYCPTAIGCACPYVTGADNIACPDCNGGGTYTDSWGTGAPPINGYRLGCLTEY